MPKLKLQDVCTIIAGVGYKEAQRIFRQGETCEIVEIEGKKYKINTGAATAKLIAKKGGKVIMLARNEKALYQIREYILQETNCSPDLVTYRVLDILDEQKIKEFTHYLSQNEKRPIWLVYSIGLGAQAYSLQGDNPYLPFTDIPPEIVVKEFEVPVKGLLLLTQNLLPIFTKQEETRIVVVTSMSGIRPYMYGYSHASAKAGIHHAVRSLALEMSYRYGNIYVSEVLPGIIDTGLYDSANVIKAVQEIGETFGFFGEKKYNEDNFPLMPPSAVAEAIALVLESDAHILSINMVARGQFVNQGA